MRWFLDMCIILYYVGEGDRKDLNKKSRKFVNEKQDDQLLLCYYIKDINIPKWLNRQKIIQREIIRKLKDNSYKLYTSSESSRLTKRDKKKITKFFILLNTIQESHRKVQIITKIFVELERRINHFLRKYVDEFVIPNEEIDFDLKSCLFTWLDGNDSDAKTIASGIQERNNNNNNNKRKLIMITADKKDWTKELLEEVHNDYQLKKKYSKLPKVEYLQDL